MKKKKKYLPLYYEWMENFYLPRPGLCKSVGEEVTNLFGPSGEYINDKWFWGFNGDEWEDETAMQRCYLFTTLRQTIVLFLAAMNDEL